MARRLVVGKLVQHTVWLKLAERFVTGKGVMTNKEWLESERDRVLSDPTRQAEVRHHPNRPGYAALLVDDVREVGARI